MRILSIRFLGGVSLYACHLLNSNMKIVHLCHYGNLLLVQVATATFFVNDKSSKNYLIVLGV